jgi:hypothetical protein
LSINLGSCGPVNEKLMPLSEAVWQWRSGNQVLSLIGRVYVEWTLHLNHARLVIEESNQHLSTQGYTCSRAYVGRVVESAMSCESKL